MDADQLLTIGQLARLAGLSTKALRHYDRLRLFRPDLVDESGYRWYSRHQVPRARLIGALRAVDLPLQAVRDVIAAPDGATFTVALDEHRCRLEARRTRITGELHDVADERALASRLFNGVWELLERPERTTTDDDTMLHMAHASRHHWAG